ncbi:MAG TPA: hypothetical protein VHK06_08095, partial [Candidatus Limnocylindria bacterium]|nr:hypothetical protein [Candidatus Limnocylindria bacterium]
MPDLIRRAAVLVLLSAAGIGLLAPLAIAGSATPRALESERLLATADGHAAATTLDRSTLSGRDRPAELSLVGSAADRAPELLAPQPAPDGPGAVPLRASIEPIP